VWDSGGVYYRWKSAEDEARAKFYDVDALRRQIILNTNLAYFRVQLACEQVRFVTDSLKTVFDQYKDISNQEKAGSLSRMDSLQAHQEVLVRQRNLRQSRADLAVALRDLFYLTGDGKNVDPSIPLDAATPWQPALGMEPATLLVTQDPRGESLTLLQPNAAKEFDSESPALQSLTESIAAAERLVSSLQSEYGPSVLLSGRISRDYPNGPILETITQKSGGVTASWPLFEGNKTVNEVKAQKKQTAALTETREDARLSLKRDWEKARDELRGLEDQREINRLTVKETIALAKLTYDSYKVGRSRYLEVETANLQAVNAKITESQTEIQILIQLAILQSLSK
jgi:outer membrane protein TolC